MKIALDFDDTVTLDINTWGQVVSLFLLSGHDVRLVTIRKEVHGSLHDDITAFARDYSLEIIFTNGRQKQSVCEERGFMPDVWIDDSPALIPSPSILHGVLEGCRKNNEFN